MAKVKAWSYSRRNSYDTCPFKFNHENGITVAKLPFESNAAMDRGNAIHKDAENFTKGDVKTLPPSLKSLSKDFRALKKCDSIAEDQWTFDKDWNLVGWFDHNAWLRIKIDNWYPIDSDTICIIDYKTGKLRLGAGYEEQLELYALAAFTLYDIQTVKTELWFVDHGKIYGRGDYGEDLDHFIYHVDQFEDLKKSWLQRIKPMMNDTRFAPTPNYLCQYCRLSKAKGGCVNTAGEKVVCKY